MPPRIPDSDCREPETRSRTPVPALDTMCYHRRGGFEVHRGVRELIRWAEGHREQLALEQPASDANIAALEQRLGTPLPNDLRHVLTRFNGGDLPSGRLLPAGRGPSTMEQELRDLAEVFGGDLLDPDIPLPFHRSDDGSVLAFDRSAGPVPDTWPVIDYFPDTREVRLVHRTFDGWCEKCLLEWSADDFDEPFSLEKYHRQGARHVRVEPDVASAHVTIAHALKRAGEPEKALASYIEAARCVPPLPWCDWEALKIATLLERPGEALEAATRLAAPAPAHRWEERETTPGRVADLVARFAATAQDPQPWKRLIDMLMGQAGAQERAHIEALRQALSRGKELPAPRPVRPNPVAPSNDLEQWWAALQAGYAEGRVRDEDLLFDPELRRLAETRSLAQMLRTRRDF